jgi:GNAT superfamily N-acetyltransferase
MTDTRTVAIRRLDRPGDLGWVVSAHGEIYDTEFGWNGRFEALVARIVADYANDHDSDREAAWIAEVDGRRAGCVFCVAKDEDTAQLRILLVDPAARGHGVGARLVSARRIYAAAGFELVEEERHRSFGHDLVGQTWVRDL